MKPEDRKVKSTFPGLKKSKPTSAVDESIAHGYGHVLLVISDYMGTHLQCMVAGAGIYHLMDDKNFYLGRLRQANGKWVFDATPKTKELEGMAEYFGDFLAAWFE